MANLFSTAVRDPRLGPYGLYSVEGTDRVGLRQALIGTERHLSMHPDAEDSTIRAELARLRTQIATTK